MTTTSPLCWKAIQRKNFTNWKTLFQFLHLDERFSSQILTQPSFALNLPFRLAEKISKGTLEDPILKQFLPSILEKEITPNFILDPVSDVSFRKERKLLHKYQGRALLLCSSACAMNCRFCFRQNFGYEREKKGFDEEIAYIREDSSLSEVILSGGDPLSLSNEVLGDLIDKLSSIPHLKLLRFHTRFPIGIPERCDAGLLEVLAKTRLQVFFVIHCNHSRELDEDILAVLKEIQRGGATLLSQTVLLKGVNDDLPTLKELCEKLISGGIVPYYLHQLDRVKGVAHFEVDQEKGRSLVEQLAKELPGYAIPRYVQEIPGMAHKQSLL